MNVACKPIFLQDSHQPLLYDDRSFDSSSSEDNAGLNSTGYIRRKTKTVRNNAKDTYSELIGCSGDDRNINHHQRSLLNRGHPNIIEIDSQAFIDTKNANIPGEPVIFCTHFMIQITIKMLHPALN